MLYIDVEVNNTKVKAFVDSGAQTTIMSPGCAERCGILRLMDKKQAGIARGVGTAKILGRVHLHHIKIGDINFTCSFTVVEGKDVDLLLGLDMLKRHQACIDLRHGKLVIGEAEVTFLGEAEIPKDQEVLVDEPAVEGPGGTKTSAISGVVSAANKGNFQGQGQTVGQSGGPSTQPQVPQASSQSSAPTSTPAFPPGDIATLMELGNTREAAINALEAARGNVDEAAGFLF